MRESRGNRGNTESRGEVASEASGAVYRNALEISFENFLEIIGGTL